MRDDLISRQMTIDLLDRYSVNPPEYMKDYSDKLLHAIKDDLVDGVNSLPSAQLDFDITVKIDKAYDDGYEAGYLQGRHDWGNLDE